MMKHQTETMRLYLEPNDKAEGPGDAPFNFFLVAPRHQWYTNDDSQIKLGDVEVSYPVPDKLGDDDIAIAAIRQLKERQEKVMADAHKTVAKIEDQISRLQLLTHQSR